GSECPSITIGNYMGTGISGIDIPETIRAGHHRMQRMVVIVSAKSGQEDFFMVRHIVTILVGVYNKVRSGRNDDLISNNGNTHRRLQIGILNEYPGLISF